ncbi:hypothetical protein [Hyphomicrobium sp. CS1GBMeth3]|uniref:hypothetical protein n=1 Tax=Hyphomicrobium sp. CS1GBMeth3 TaxID=1892845 RepID=UPI00092FE30F|nr:hypothetical protein [Hyphomicrobium sp. CS1GBMeth3]
MTPELRTTIEDAYRVFGGYRLDGALIVCNCNCCVSAESERRLIRTPLREIPYQLLAEYTDSAHGWDEIVADNMRYFLPRYFELIALNSSPFDMHIDDCLRRLAHARWRDEWPAAEAEIIDRFFQDLIVSSVRKLDLVKWPVGWRLKFDLVDVLTLIVTAHGDIGRALAAWDAADGRFARARLMGGRAVLSAFRLPRARV